MLSEPCCSKHGTRLHCMVYMKADPCECRHLSDLLLSLDLYGQECGIMLCSVWPGLLVDGNSHLKDVGPWKRDGMVRCVYVQCREVAVCFCSWLPEKHPAHASAAALARQWQCCLAFRARGQGGASHHLPTKAQVTQPASALPHFLPSPHNSPHPTAGPAEKTVGFSPIFPLLVSHATPSNPSAFMVQYFHPFLKRLTPFSVFQL